ncbi:hypothetical protein ASPSYDRAFT_40219 [Aspergillus sydowii CBS 593.65]|uniref:Uncharacterized protein n=1 Tax=Aspergillus sydowii CBS 593.65 TaxID=1036612 RepID=A0A1L9U184_9EURO|nr:uncharacterized protein ASPSYDRAFT_40219 [Aspergillus sydowii CBS 593.65]OJJ65412.1 hypothetical protein ASPSYDRAFT_40219 [Aspergillus sydowii CBS 593.65]
MGGRRASTSTWCPLGILRETIWLSLSAGWSSTTRSSPFSRRADAPKTDSPSLRTSRNTKHHRTSTREEVVPPHTYAPTTENGPCHSIYPAQQSFTVPDLEDYAMQTRSGRPDLINTTQSQQSPAENLRPRRRLYSAPMPPRVKIILQPHETPNITEPVPERKSCSCPTTRKHTRRSKKASSGSWRIGRNPWSTPQIPVSRNKMDQSRTVSVDSCVKVGIV